MSSVSIGLLFRRFLDTWRAEGGGKTIAITGRYLGRRFRRALPRWPGVVGRRADAAYLTPVWQDLARNDAFHICQSPGVLRRRRQVALIGDLNLPQCRKYRVEQLAAFLRGRDVEVDYAHFEDVPRATRILQLATHVIEYRLSSNPVTEMLRYEARRLRLPVLYDLDDPLFSVPAYETYRNMQALDPSQKAAFLAAAPGYLSMMNGADAISVSTPGMVAHSKLFTNRPLFLRRNFADHETLRAGEPLLGAKPSDGTFRVVFSSGSKGHEADLQEIAEPLAEFIGGAENRELLIVGYFDRKLLPPALSRRSRMVGFSDYGGYLANIARADCAIMPLSDDKFNRCKSAVRVLDAAAVGVPCVVSAIGDLPNVTSHGQTGLVAETAADWASSLRRIASDPRDAARMGAAARQDVETRWGASEAPRIIDPEMLRWIDA